MTLQLLLSRFSRVQLFATPWTAAYQAPPSMGFSRQEYWSGMPLPSPVIILAAAAAAAAKSLQLCPTLCDPIDGSPPGTPCPWDSPGKNTGVGCHFLLQCRKVKSEREVAQLSNSSRPHGLQPTRLLHPWDFPGKSIGVGCH